MVDLLLTVTAELLLLTASRCMITEELELIE